MTDRVVGDAEFIELVEDHAHVVVVLDHGVVVVALPAQPAGLVLDVGTEVHAGRVPPQEERLVAAGRFFEVLERPCRRLVVDGLHAFLGERPGVLDLLGAVRHRPAVDDAAGTEALAKRRVLRVVRLLGLFLGVEVVQVAEELVEPVVGGQMLVTIAQVVLAELRGRIAVRLQEFGDCRVLSAEPFLRTREAHLREPRAQRVLPRDEGRATGGAALLPVEVGEPDALSGQPVDVGRRVAHHPLVVGADVPVADVIPPQHEDVRFAVGHSNHLAIPGRFGPSAASILLAARSNFCTPTPHTASFATAARKGALVGLLAPDGYSHYVTATWRDR